MKMMHHTNRTARLLPIAALAVLAIACAPSPSALATITGEIKGLGDDTLYLYGADRLYGRTDTIVAAGGRFSVTARPDTLAAVWLRLPGGEEYPIFMQRGDEIAIEGTAGGSLSVTGGNAANEELGGFLRMAEERGIAANGRELAMLADTFIRAHPASLASIYLLERCFVQQPRPDIRRILRLAEGMAGSLQDRPYVRDLVRRLQEAENTRQGRPAPVFRVPDAKGGQKTRAAYKDKWLLVHFWASWDSLSRTGNAGWRKLYKKVKKDKSFALVGASLDTDRALWLEAVKQDTLEWEQLCDLAGWAGNGMAGKFSIHALPSNVLLSPDGRIEDKDLSPEEVERRLEKEAAGKKNKGKK